MKQSLLLEKYLSGSLDSAEQDYFNRLLLESPEFAAEVDMLTRIENTLDSIQYRDLKSYDPFLKRTEAQLQARFDAAKVAPASHGFPLFIKIFFSITAIGLVGIASWFYAQDFSENVPDNASKYEAPATDTRSLITPKAPVERVETPAIAALKTKSPQPNALETASLPDTNSVPRLDVNFQVQSPNTAHEKQFALLKNQLASAEAKNDNIAQALYLHKLGTAYRLNHQDDNARQYLLAASEKARSQKLFETEVAALGELGLLEAKAGDIIKAEKYYRSCIAILKEQGKDTGHWENMIDELKK